MSKNHSTALSFKYAISGLAQAIKNEPNIRVHLVIAFLVIIAGWFFHISPTEWVILIFTIAFVLVLELFNTTIEAIVDLVNPKIHPKAKLAKDVSAAAVFVTAMFAIIVGVFVFLPKIITLIFSLSNK